MLLRPSKNYPDWFDFSDLMVKADLKEMSGMAELRITFSGKEDCRSDFLRWLVSNDLEILEFYQEGLDLETFALSILEHKE